MNGIDLKLDCEGPFGFKMPTKQAQALDTLLKSLPSADRQPIHLGTAVPDSIGRRERSDTSWISIEEPDKQGDVVLASGMDDSVFRMNPVVTLAHDRNQPGVGRNLWIKEKEFDKGRGVSGLIAKTVYPPRPKDHEGPWRPDVAFNYVDAGTLNGKSIGAVCTSKRNPTAAEIKAHPDWKGRCIRDKWTLYEYAVCALPVGGKCTVLDIQKAFTELPEEVIKALGSTELIKADLTPALPATINAIPLDAVRQYVAWKLTGLKGEIEKNVRRGVDIAFARHTGRV